MEFFSLHREAVSAAVIATLLALAPNLLPAFNKKLAFLTGNQYVKKGLRIAKALEDGDLTVEELGRAKTLLED